MQVISLGKITPTPGTPKQLTTDSTIFANRIVVTQPPTGTGNNYFGTSTLNKTTLVGLLKAFLPAGASGFVDEHVVESEDNSNTLRVSDFYVDADNASNGLVAYYVVR
jgi:hypothetical protein